MKITVRSNAPTMITTVELETAEEIEAAQTALWRAHHDPKTPPDVKAHVEKLYKLIRANTGLLSRMDQD